MAEFSQNKLTDAELEFSKIKFWSRMGLVFSILSSLSTLLFLNISGVPLSIFLGIFALSFVIISKNISGKLSKKNTISIILSIWGILLGILLFLLFLFTAYRLQDPVVGNETLEKTRNILDLLEKTYNVNLGNFSRF